MKDPWQRWQGAWVSFWPKPEQYNTGGYRSCLVFIGQVLLVTPRPDSEVGRIPNADLVVQGISKRRMTINSLTHNARRHDDYEGAVKRSKGQYE